MPPDAELELIHVLHGAAKVWMQTVAWCAVVRTEVCPILNDGCLNLYNV
jgi:hypothetical protein